MDSTASKFFFAASILLAFSAIIMYSAHRRKSESTQAWRPWLSIAASLQYVGWGGMLSGSANPWWRGLMYVGTLGAVAIAVHYQLQRKGRDHG